MQVKADENSLEQNVQSRVTATARLCITGGKEDPLLNADRSQVGRVLGTGWGPVEQGTQRLKSLSPRSSHSRGGDKREKCVLREREAGRGRRACGD